MATLPVEQFGTQSPSKFQHFTFLGQKLTDVPIWSTFLSSILQGRPQDLGGGGQEFFFLDLGICAWRSIIFYIKNKYFRYTFVMGYFS